MAGRKPKTMMGQATAQELEDRKLEQGMTKIFNQREKTQDKHFLEAGTGKVNTEKARGLAKGAVVSATAQYHVSTGVVLEANQNALETMHAENKKITKAVDKLEGRISEGDTNDGTPGGLAA